VAGDNWNGGSQTGGEFGALDFLVNNAGGLVARQPLSTM